MKIMKTGNVKIIKTKYFPPIVIGKRCNLKRVYDNNWNNILSPYVFRSNKIIFQNSLI